ncbi:MAG TPA: hypothetical protein VF997_07920 [Polyangia bacterium]
MLTTSAMLMWVALAGSLVLVAQYRPVVFPVIALVVSLFEALMTFHLLSLSVAHVPLALVFGIALLVSGLLVYWKASAKVTVAASTAVALVGLLQTMGALHLH